MMWTGDFAHSVKGVAHGKQYHRDLSPLEQNAEVLHLYRNDRFDEQNRRDFHSALVSSSRIEAEAFPMTRILALLLCLAAAGWAQLSVPGTSTTPAAPP